MANSVLLQCGIAIATIATNALVHAIFVAVIRPFLRFSRPRPGVVDDFWNAIRLVVVSVWLIVAHTTSAAVWSLVFLQLGVSPDFEAAMYFALSTYTTLGFGDVLAPSAWQLLTGFAALNGLLLFGLSAAVLVDAAHTLRYRRTHIIDHSKNDSE